MPDFFRPYALNGFPMKDNFSKQAGLYAKYRPTYPRELYVFILNNTTHTRTAWDCGTATGRLKRDSKPF